MDGFDPPSLDMFCGRIGKYAMLKLHAMNVLKNL